MIRQSLLLSFFGQYIVLVINFVSTIILARILTPSDIGIFSVAIFFVALSHILRDFGVGQYLIQEKNYPASLIAIEKGLKLNNLQMRTKTI